MPGDPRAQRGDAERRGVVDPSRVRARHARPRCARLRRRRRGLADFHVNHMAAGRFDTGRRRHHVHHHEGRNIAARRGRQQASGAALSVEHQVIADICLIRTKDYLAYNAGAAIARPFWPHDGAAMRDGLFAHMIVADPGRLIRGESKNPDGWMAPHLPTAPRNCRSTRRALDRGGRARHAAPMPARRAQGRPAVPPRYRDRAVAARLHPRRSCARRDWRSRTSRSCIINDARVQRLRRGRPRASSSMSAP